MTHSLVTPSLDIRKVPDSRRLACLPKHFPNAYLAVETHIFDMMSRISESYCGGYWEFYEIANGGFYMIPEGPAQMEIVVPFGNGFSECVSKEVAGIAATMLGLSFAMQLAHDQTVPLMPGYDLRADGNRLYDHFTNLRHLIGSHPDGSTILRAID